MPHANDPEQLASKKPPQNAPARSLMLLNTRDLVLERRTRNQENEEEVQDEVRKSCQNVRWTRGPLPANIDHWFYDLRHTGTEHPESLVAASRIMVLNWKRALGRSYYPVSRDAGGAVMSLEHAHRTFKAVTLNMLISGWVSRAYAKHQIMHDMLSIPKLVAKDGDLLKTRPVSLNTLL
jgi:hypothetical protein